MKNNIKLEKISLDKLINYYKNFENDPMTYINMSTFSKYKYDEEKVVKYYKRISEIPNRIDFMILKDGDPIGEIGFKNIGLVKREGEFSIHLQNDSVKNKGYGTIASEMLLDFGFNDLGFKKIYASSILKNKRSQHFLEKLGFKLKGQDEIFKYYFIEKFVK